MLCDTSGVGERSGVLSTGSPFGHHPRLHIVYPRRGQWVKMSYFFSYQEIKLFGGVCFLLFATLFVALKNTIRA